MILIEILDKIGQTILNIRGGGVMGTSAHFSRSCPRPIPPVSPRPVAPSPQLYRSEADVLDNLLEACRERTKKDNTQPEELDKLRNFSS